MIAVLVSCVMLTFDNPGVTGEGPTTHWRTMVRCSEIIFLLIMTFEQVRVRAKCSFEC